MIDLRLADLLDAHEEEQCAQPIATPSDLKRPKRKPAEQSSDAACEPTPGKAKSP
jgi:hypothetical protein